LNCRIDFLVSIGYRAGPPSPGGAFLGYDRGVPLLLSREHIPTMCHSHENRRAPARNASRYSQPLTFRSVSSALGFGDHCGPNTHSGMALDMGCGALDCR
jgi:hypothetical protein